MTDHDHGRSSSELGRRHSRLRIDQWTLQDYITWGNRESVEFSGEGLITPTNAQLVDAKYERPMTWTVALLLDATIGAWVATDTVTLTWLVRTNVGQANNPFPQAQTITFPIAGGGPAIAYQAIQVPAHTIQVSAFKIFQSVADANKRSLTWSAWVAPIVE